MTSQWHVRLQLTVLEIMLFAVGLPATFGTVLRAAIELCVCVFAWPAPVEFRVQGWHR